jgi:HEAT repeat protein
MRTKSSCGIISSLLKQLKRLAFTLNEKPSTAVEEYTLEHFLLYHGLVGTSPENQPEFKQVRADILEAFEHRSSLSLSIALKLQPLWWEDKLQSIISEAKAAHGEELCLNLLCPPEAGNEELPPAQNPLKSEDWRVRSNAANLLSFLNDKSAIPRVIESLGQTSTDSLKAAFCHISFSLSQLQSEQSKAALVKYLDDEEPWFRVDAARALATWPWDAVAADLARAVLAHHNLSDYTAIVIARKHHPLALLKHAEPVCQEAGLEMVIEIIKASAQTFQSEIVMETGVHWCWPELSASAKGYSSARRIRATLALSEWLRDNSSLLAEHQTELAIQPADQEAAATLRSLSEERLLAQVDEAIATISSELSCNQLAEALEKYHPSDDSKLDDIRHTIWLIGKLGVRGSAPRLVALLKEHPPFTDDMIDALGLLGDPIAAEQLIELARRSVDLEDRQSRPASAHPVEESDAAAAKHYWLILKALGHIPHSGSIELLLDASEDFAPDKRQQALQSLISACRKSDYQENSGRVHGAIARCLQDPSAQVRMVALDGVSQLELIDLSTKALKLFDSKEVSVSRKSLSVMSELADAGHKKEVSAAVESKLRSEFDRFKKEKLQNFLDGL